jgi:hypothetical protein
MNPSDEPKQDYIFEGDLERFSEAIAQFFHDYGWLEDPDSWGDLKKDVTHFLSCHQKQP